MVIETGKISLKDIQFNCILGTLPFEREKEQPVVLNVSVWLDFSLAARNDDLVHSIDYAQLSQDLQEFIRMSQFQLETGDGQAYPRQLPQGADGRGKHPQAAGNPELCRSRIQHPRTPVRHKQSNFGTIDKACRDAGPFQFMVRYRRASEISAISTFSELRMSAMVRATFSMR